MPVHTHDTYDWWLYGNRHKTKKERKKEYREFRYKRAMRNWHNAEPPAWRFIAHLLWKRREPKEV